MILPKTAGIYKITNTLNGLYYVGSSVNINKRYKGHFSKLRAKAHANFHLQAAFNKYGEPAFIFEVLENCVDFTLEDLRATEQKYLDGIENWKDCYNMVKIAVQLPPASAETKKKMSEARSGLAKNFLGKSHSDCSKLEMSNSSRVRGAGIKQSKFDTFHVSIKVLGIKKELYFGTYSSRELAAKVRLAAESFYWDGCALAEIELQELKLLSNPNQPPKPSIGHTTTRKSGTGITQLQNGNWRCCITVKQLQISLGTYQNKEDALKSRMLAEKVYWDNDSSFAEALKISQAKASSTQRRIVSGAGVTLTSNGTYEARITVAKKTRRLGCFATKEEAIERRALAENYYHRGDSSLAYLFDVLKEKRDLPTGVYKKGDKFAAEICVAQVKKYLGTFPTVEEALQARKAAELLYL